MNLKQIGWFLVLLVAGIAVLHVILCRRDARVALAWVAVIGLSPVLGPILYFVFGLNRIKRRAVAIRQDDPGGGTASAKVPQVRREVLVPPPAAMDQSRSRLCTVLERIGNKLIKIPLEERNSIHPLFNGDQAFPAMLRAIAQARSRILLSTYIFDNDAVGNCFVSALKDAKNRGVEIRVLVDDMGAKYSFPSIIRKLRKAGIPTARFLPIYFPWQVEFLNLRLHRKCMLVDGVTAFIGGMNIRDGNLLQKNPRHPVQDVQFRVLGPVVSQCEKSFLDDWLFAAKEKLAPSKGSEPQVEGQISARCIADGPDSHAEKTSWMILAALSAAEKSVRIMTPYFFPDHAILMALANAAMRGVTVDIVLPQKNNLPWFQWAANTVLWQILEHGCRVWLSPGPFRHSKLFVVDGEWTLLGSSNWDRRSLRLNFELNLECYDRQFAGQIDGHILALVASSHLVTLEEMDSRPFLKRLRDGSARLLAPLL